MVLLLLVCLSKMKEKSKSPDMRLETRDSLPGLAKSKLLVDVSSSTSLSLKNEDNKVNPAAASIIQDEDREGKHTTRRESGNKRPFVRRQSARLKSKLLVHVSSSTSLSLKNEDNKVNPAPGFETLESKRSSLSRPVREAVKKVHSYKKIPLNIKMHRTQ